ncbi:MAG: NAD(P)-dependent oxidoreductase [Patescibacteria group bacterium]
MSNKLGVVGNGNIGSALGQVFADCGWRVEYFDAITSKRTVDSLSELADKSDVIIIAAPSWVNREVAEGLKPSAKGKLVLTVAKGVEAGFVTMDKVLEQVADGKFDHGVVYGPMLAAEIAKGKPAALLVATKGKQWTTGLSANSQLTIHYCEDPYSVALCGALKNIYAVALGINDGLELGHNSKGALAVAIIEEFGRLLQDLGGDPKQALGLAGIGDILATGWSDSSFNHRIGRLIVKDPAGSVPRGEGISSLSEVSSKLKLADYPVIQTLYSIVFEGTQPQALRKLV